MHLTERARFPWQAAQRGQARGSRARWFVRPDFPSCPFDIDVDPLPVTRTLRELVDHGLIDLDPVGSAKVVADAVQQFGELDRHFRFSPGEAGCGAALWDSPYPAPARMC